MLDKVAIIQNISARESIKHNFIPDAYLKTEVSEEEGYVISAPINGKGNEFVADGINFLSAQGYILKDYRLSYVEEGLFTVAANEYMTELLRRFPDAAIAKITSAVLISDDWNEIMAYFETASKMYLYVWNTSA